MTVSTSTNPSGKQPGGFTGMVMILYVAMLAQNVGKSVVFRWKSMYVQKRNFYVIIVNFSVYCIVSRKGE